MKTRIISCISNEEKSVIHLIDNNWEEETIIIKNITNFKHFKNTNNLQLMINQKNYFFEKLEVVIIAYEAILKGLNIGIPIYFQKE